MTALPAPRLLSGPAGALVHVIDSPVLGRIDFTVLDPVADLDVLHEWTARPTSRFWGLGDKSRDELRDTYLFVDSLPSHHAFLVRRDGLPILLLQTYEPENDPLGEAYDALPGDAGLHFLLGARGAPTPQFSSRVADVLAAFLFSSPGVDRLVIEPDVRNERAIARAVKSGFELGQQVELEHKTGQLAFLSRERWGRHAARDRPDGSRAVLSETRLA